MTGKVVIHLGPEEKSMGLSYVAFSRITTPENIGINCGLSLERISNKIKFSLPLQRRRQADQ
jgi:hypothetical protein